MAYDQQLAFRIRQHLASMPYDLTEKKMFGGLAFLYKGKMTVGVNKEDLMVRIIDGKWQEALKQHYVNEMKFTGKAMKEFVFVEPSGYETEEQLAEWIELGVEHARQKLGEL